MRRRLFSVQLLFFFSGAAGLVYQVVWSRILNEIFGISAHAVTVVVATFLGGLALGGWLLGRAADRRRNPLRFYGLLEVGIAAAALAGSWIVRAFDPVHIWAATRFAPGSIPLLAVRMVLASAVILPPTFLMGGTLPAITRVFVDDLGRLGRRLSFLYALNTAGAVLGSLTAGFVLIRAIGLHPTLWLAVAVNLAVGAASLALASCRERSPGAPCHRGDTGGAREARETTPAKGLLVVTAISGFASLSLEMIWTRMLVLVFGTSTYAFVTMLSTFLVGIALGSFIARAFVDRLGQPRRAFGWIQLGIAASTMVSLMLTRSSIDSAYRWLDTLELHWGALTIGRFGLSFAIMIVPTTLIGMTFPVAARAWTRRLDAVGGDVGQVYGANTAGNIAGAIVGGFVILPVLGIQRGVAVLATLNLAGAAWGLLPSVGRGGARASRWRAVALCGTLSACVLSLVAWRPAPLPGTGGGPSDPVRFYREGIVSTVKVVQRADDGRQMIMTVDGVTIGQSTTGVDRKQQVLAHLPFVLESRQPIADVLSIGLGTGILVGEVARHPGVARIECVELSRSVIDGARAFAAHNLDALANPTVRIVTDDGVNYLRRSRASYDAIISDGKSKSGHAGNALFYSDEYYRSAREHLAPGGVMIQWVPLDVAPADLRTIIRTFMGVFGHTYVWLGQDSCFLVGLDRPLILDMAHAQRILDAPEARHLRRHGWRSADDVASLLVADADALRPWLSRETTINSLEHPVLEFYSMAGLSDPAPARTARNLAALAEAGRGGLHDVELVGGDPRTLDENRRAVSEFIDGVSALALGDSRGLYRVRKAIAAAPGQALVGQWGATTLFNVGRDLDVSGDQLHAIELYREALRSWPEFVEARLNLGRSLSLVGRRDDAIAEYRHSVQLNPESATAHLALGELLRDAGDLQGAIRHAREVLRIDSESAQAQDDLGLSLAFTGRYDEALAHFREAMRLSPAWPLPLDRAALVLATLPGPTAEQVNEAVALATRAMKLTHSGDALTLETLAAAYAAGGRFQDASATERRALDLVRGTADPRVIEQISATLELYRRGKALAGVAAYGPSAGP